jgi:transposase
MVEPNFPEMARLGYRLADVVEEQIARIAQLEAEVARLREALEEISEGEDRGRHDGKPESGPLEDWRSQLIARRALNGGEDA